MATKTSSCSSSLSLFSSPLTIDQLIDVLNLLKRCGFPQTRWHELGLTLGLHKNTLDVIERNHPSDVSRCLLECLSQWLSRADNVDSKGGATFDSLSDALKSMNENAAADKLDQEKRKAKAIDIFNTHHPLLSQSLSDPVSVARLLNREGVITGQVLASVVSASPSVPNQREVLLAAIIVAIESKYSLLQTFASVLCKFTGNVKLGTVIQRDYGLLDQNESLIDIKREIDELQEQMSVMSVHILNKREENEEYREVIKEWREQLKLTSSAAKETETAELRDEDDDKVNKPIAKSVFIARYDYHATGSDEISFSEGEQLEIYEKLNSFWWKGRSLVTGVVGVIPSSCVYSMLESLQLLEFILSVEEVFLPILQKIRTDSSSNDEKASLFLETINDDPIMISALRQDKEQHDKGNICDNCCSQYNIC
uniref:SH3 domain-containing protein n=1 Tax=Amphimedon queenslandica TaxID=400682 RepID=A0A1X7T4V5_AMPQE